MGDEALSGRKKSIKKKRKRIRNEWMIVDEETNELVTYLFVERVRNPNGMVTCGDSATYPMVGGVQQGP